MQEDRTRLRYLTQKLSTNSLTNKERAELHRLLLDIDIIPIKKFSKVTRVLAQ